MKALQYSALLLALALPATASVPEQKPLAHYRELWEESLITNDPPPDEPPEPGPNPLDDYTLASVCQLGDAWHVVLLHKKQRDQRVRLKSGKPNEHGFRIVDVQNPSSRKKAAVEIQAETFSATLRFEAQFLQVRKTPAVNPGPRATPQSAQRLRQPVNANAKNVRRIPGPAQR